MRNVVLLLMFGLGILSCNNPKGGKPVSTENTSVINADSVKITGERIIQGESIWGNNEQYVFALMDSLTAVSAESRLFYLRVFARIVEQSDGYLAESIGLYVLRYFELNPKEFVIHSNHISDSTFRLMGQHAGLELFLSSSDNGKEAYQELEKSVRQKVGQMSNNENYKFDLFLKYILESLNSQENLHSE